jgi:predicted nucleotidyltransferase
MVAERVPDRAFADVRPQALEFCDTLASRCANALDDAIVSVILHGSLALDDFVPRRSDIDLLLVVEHPLTDGQLAALRDVVEQLRSDAPARVDLRVVTRATASSPTRAPALEAAFVLRPGDGLDMATRVGEQTDLVIEFSVARAHGRSIVGDAPNDVIGSVPRRWLVEIGDRQVARWERLADDDRSFQSCSCWTSPQMYWRCQIGTSNCLPPSIRPFTVSSLTFTSGQLGRRAAPHRAKDPGDHDSTAALRRT